MNLKDKTVVIDNKTYCYSKIVMLPTEDKNGLVQFGRSLRRFLDNLSQMVVNYQHLYFLSTDKICDGDWYLDDVNQVRKSITSDKDYWDRRPDYYKVIASTNPECNLPKPSDSFLKVYIDAYNKGEKIEECLVEYEEYWVNLLGIGEEKRCRLKTNKSNQISITKVKDSWSRDEVVELCKKAFNAGMAYSTGSYTEFKQIHPNREKWISENL